MISSICIEGFRRFDAFKLENLGRINLIMGDNNCGKTSVLEAIHLLTSRASREALIQAIWRRDRVVMSLHRVHRPNRKSSASSLFVRHKCEEGTKFKLYSKSQTSGAHLVVRITDETRDKRQDIRDIDGNDLEMALILEGNPEPFVTQVPINSAGDVTKGMLSWSSRRMHWEYLRNGPKSISITPAELDAFDLNSMWSDIVLTPDEERITQTLGSLDGGIERIVARFSGEVSQDTDPGYAEFLVKHKQFPERVPMESLGSGVWRLFSLAIAVVYCRNGTLLVDGIDNGLDLASLSIMWRMLLSIAQEFDVQIFATTHNLDCVNTLAEEACNASVDSNVCHDVVFHRIEVGKQEPVQLSPTHVRIAEKHFLEIR